MNGRRWGKRSDSQKRVRSHLTRRDGTTLGDRAKSLSDAEFFLQHQVNKVQVAHLVGLGPPDERGDDLGEMSQAQRCRGGFDAVGGQLARRFSFAASA